MKIAVVNDIHVGRPLTSNGKIRAASHLIEGKLEVFLQNIIRLHTPDVLVNLGDLIRSENEEKDLKSYSKLLSYFTKIQCPVIHLLGNHEIKKMTYNALEKAWLEQGFHQKSFGSTNIGGYHLIWLGLGLDQEDHQVCFLPHEQLNWLKVQLQKTEDPILIFSHCPLDDHDTRGNFFYEAMDNRSKKALFLKNQEEVRNIIAYSSNVKALFQAHLHYFNVKIIDHIPYFTCPAMGDNICSTQVEDNIPEIYTIIDIDQDKLTVKAFSGEFCFTGYEVSLSK